MTLNDFFDRHPDLTPRMRILLFEWMADISTYTETYCKACDIFDIYIKVCDPITRSTLQLVGSACLFCADVYYDEPINDYVKRSAQAFTFTQLNETVLDIKKKLMYDFHRQTVYDLYRPFITNDLNRGHNVLISNLLCLSSIDRLKLTLMLFDNHYYPELVEYANKWLELYTLKHSTKRWAKPSYTKETCSGNNEFVAPPIFHTSPAKLHFKEYTKVEHLRDGGYGSIFTLAESNDILGKIMDDDTSQICGTQEILFNQRVNSHPNIVRLIDVTKDEMMIFERGICDLTEYYLYPSFTIEVLRKFARDILLGVKHCHSRGVLHADIKPGNIIIFKATSEYTSECTNEIPFVAKIGDFGISKIMVNDSYCGDNIYTPEYAPPEVLKNCCASSKSDVWAIGCTILEMYLKTRPFAECVNSENKNVDYELLLSKVTQVLEMVNDIVLHTVLSKMLVCDPQLRISVDEALEYFP